ncbi:MAG: peptidoglycan DD-metalloendopeptidase family protein [Pseudomonadales bacterium]|nr:peptidoglycan DD-metalloendopeptidase family protein [Pseudomonadales bacterium]
MFSALFGCGHSRHVQVRDLRQSPLTADSYIVEKGDTLYSIAWRFNFDYHKLAKANHILSPYILHIGQVIALTEKVSKKQANKIVSHSHKKPVSTSHKKTVHLKKQPSSANKTKSYSNQKKKSVQQKYVQKLPVHNKDKGWLWPVSGKVVRKFSPQNELSKGIDIAARVGTPIKSSRSGKVVYAGSGLKGYGNLIIVRHDAMYLSAYAHNRRILVKEGSLVSQGQTIAELGSSGTQSPKLHFEIRKKGKPINPLTLLSK